VKHHGQCNVSSSHSQDVVIKIIDTLQAQLVENIFHPLTTFCSFSQLIYYYLKLSVKAFRLFQIICKMY